MSKNSTKTNKYLCTLVSAYDSIKSLASDLNDGLSVAKTSQLTGIKRGVKYVFSVHSADINGVSHIGTMTNRKLENAKIYANADFSKLTRDSYIIYTADEVKPLNGDVFVKNGNVVNGKLDSRLPHVLVVGTASHIADYIKALYVSTKPTTKKPTATATA